jgi:hypothetical protein
VPSVGAPAISACLQAANLKVRLALTELGETGYRRFFASRSAPSTMISV